MDHGLLEDYGEAILYVLLSAAALGMAAAALGAFTAF